MKLHNDSKIQYAVNQKGRKLEDRLANPIEGLYGLRDMSDKIALRAIRRDGIDEAKAKQKNSEITEDELKSAETEIQKITDKYIDEIDKILADKEKEIMSV